MQMWNLTLVWCSYFCYSACLWVWWTRCIVGLHIYLECVVNENALHVLVRKSMANEPQIE